MKKKFLSIKIIISTASLVSGLAFGSADLDRQYDLSSIGALRSIDNMDGLFGDYLAAAFKEYFSQESRFVFNDLGKADSILTQSKIPYSQVVYDTDILAKLARVTRTESIIRTKVLKEDTKFYFTFEWLHSPQMEVMSTLSFAMDQPADGTALGSEAINEAVATNLTRLILSLPFSAAVTGRDQQSVTVNIGTHISVKPGDTLVLGTLDVVKKHPLLKSIVDWQLTPTGRVRVDQLEDGMAFCRILSEEPGKEISRSQKVMQLIPAPVREFSTEVQTEKQVKEEPPRLGWVGATAILGMHSRQFSNPAGVNNTGGGLAFGGKAAGEIWLTREWFVGASFGYAMWNLSQQALLTQVQTPASIAGGVSGAMSTFRGELGYAFLMNGDFFGPKGWVKLGYKVTSYSLPTETVAEYTGPLSMGSVMIGVGGDLPLKGNWGARADLNFRVISSASASWVGDTVSGTSDVDFFLGGYYKYAPRVLIRFGLDMILSGVDFTAGSSLGQKTITIGPALLYYL